MTMQELIFGMGNGHFATSVSSDAFVVSICQWITPIFLVYNRTIIELRMPGKQS
jgi:hypothetical protein